jgi:hypothetical protein
LKERLDLNGSPDDEGLGRPACRWLGHAIGGAGEIEELMHTAAAVGAASRDMLEFGVAAWPHRRRKKRHTIPNGEKS